MAKSKVAKKFHLDPDGYLTTRPDRQLTTEEEAADAAEAAIGEALEEGGAIAEAIGGAGVGVVHFTRGEQTEDGPQAVYEATADKTFNEVCELLNNANGAPVFGCIALNEGSEHYYLQVTACRLYDLDSVIVFYGQEKTIERWIEYRPDSCTFSVKGIS